MIKQLENLSGYIARAEVLDKKKILDLVQGADQSLFGDITNEKKIEVWDRRKQSVTEIRKYDLLYVKTFGKPHYILIIKVDKEKGYGLVVTSTDKNTSAIHIVQKDRILFGSHVSSSIVSYSLEDCVNNFGRKYENIREADEIFRKVKNYYKQILHL